MSTMNFVNNETLYYIGNFPGKLVVFLVENSADDLVPELKSYLKDLLNASIVEYSINNFIIGYGNEYKAALLSRIWSHSISTTSYFIVRNWSTVDEYNVLDSHPFIHIISVGNSDDTEYDFALRSDMPLELQVANFIKTLRGGL